MSTAALVLSHAGAGTCLEALEAGKPLLVVVNDFLADNHQLELASKFNQEGYSKSQFFLAMSQMY